MLLCTVAAYVFLASSVLQCTIMGVVLDVLYFF